MIQETIFGNKKPKKEIYEVFTDTMEALFLEDSKVVYIDADLMASMRSSFLWDQYPDHVFNTGIQEANLVGVASGMYLAGLKPYIHTFAPFAARRDLDQLFVSVGYAEKSVRVIGSEPGICATDNGGTHMTFEDMAIMRAIPGTCIVDVSDACLFRFALKNTKDRKGITYIRTPRRNLPDIYPENTGFEIGKGKILKEGEDLTIIASGIMLATSLEAAGILENLGIRARVVDPITVKPLDLELIIDSAKKTGAILTAENHNIAGGLGGAVCEIVAERCPVPVFRLGIRDVFGQVGSEEYLRKTFGLLNKDVVSMARAVYQKKKESFT